MSKQCYTLWEEEVLPLLVYVKKNISVDPTLVSTIEEVIQKVTSDICYNQNFSIRIRPLMGILSDSNYRKFIYNLLEKEQFDKINALAESLNKLFKITTYEFNEEIIESEIVQNKERIKNPQVDVNDLYKASTNKRIRIFD